MLGLRSVALVAALVSLGACKRIEITDLDADNDGVTADEDCNDGSPAVFPGATEVCDGVDNDCDEEIDEGTDCEDNDEDGFVAAVDCDDENEDIHPGAPESCDGDDNDCDGTTDEGTECFDDDFDGASEEDGDCNDANANTGPGEPEVCDGQDNNCNDQEDEGIDCSADGDSDGFTVAEGDCDDTNADINPTETESCDTKDNDCDGDIDEGTSCFDDDRDGQTEDGGDCDDADASTWTGALEVCDGQDNNCNNQDDDGIDCSGDRDGDGYTTAQGDCADTNDTRFPGATEICNQIDEDCDGDVDEDTPCSDDDGDTFSENDGDCDDTNAAIKPGAVEVTDNVDNDCDGQIDENLATCDTNEVEPNGSSGLSDAVDLNELACGEIGTAGDQDWFRIALDEWTQLSVDIDAEWIDSDLDSKVTLYDSALTVLATNDNDLFGETVDSYIDILIPDSGTYYVKVEDARSGAGSATHDYWLWMFGFDVCDHEEVEPNGTYVVADSFPLEQTACGRVSSWQDHDYFEFTVAADTFVTFNVDAYGIGTGLEAQITVYDTDGVTILVSDEPAGTSDPFVTWYFADAGTYFVDVESDGLFNDEGAFLLRTSTF